MIFTVLAIKMEDGWRAPAFYTQERVGLGGRIFRVLKFRSMRQDAELNGSTVGPAPRPACDARRCCDPQAARRRTATDLQRAARPHELRGPASRAAGVRSGTRGQDPLLHTAALREARNHRLGSAVLPLRLIRAAMRWRNCSTICTTSRTTTLLFDLAILVQTAEVVLLGKGAR